MSNQIEIPTKEYEKSKLTLEFIIQYEFEEEVDINFMTYFYNLT